MSVRVAGKGLSGRKPKLENRNSKLGRGERAGEGEGRRVGSMFVAAITTDTTAGIYRLSNIFCDMTEGKGLTGGVKSAMVPVIRGCTKVPRDGCYHRCYAFQPQRKGTRDYASARRLHESTGGMDARRWDGGWGASIGIFQRKLFLRTFAQWALGFSYSPRGWRASERLRE